MAILQVNIFWFRRDLRLNDNTGLYHALASDLPVVPLFIFDTNILDDLEEKNDARVTFIHDQITKINDLLKKKKSGLTVKYGEPFQIWKKLIGNYNIKQVFTNGDYEPYARERDNRIKELLEENGIIFKTYKDHVLFEKDEVVKDNGEPYVIFTPYSRQWKKNSNARTYEILPSALYFSNFLKRPAENPVSLKKIGFERNPLSVPSSSIADKTLKKYKDLRDYPAEKGTSRLGIHLRFGTISIRQIASEAVHKSDVFLNELIWREFYQMILWHFPCVVNENFKTKYNNIKWQNNEKDFEKWCLGKTGFPMVDAGMRQLNNTGYMHNRVRMVTASFLTKHLLIDWRWGEAYFAKKLLDYELASNNGGWHWAAGTGTDAQPYFRIFNPESQLKKFDPELKYVKHWIPEYGTSDYPKPMVDHKKARERALKTYKSALN